MRKSTFIFGGALISCLLFSGCARASESAPEENMVSVMPEDTEDGTVPEPGTECDTASEPDGEDDTAPGPGREHDTVPEPGEEAEDTNEVQEVVDEDTSGADDAGAERTRLEDEPYYYEYDTGYIETFPDAVYPAEEWFSQDGALAFPFSRQELNSPDLGAWERIAMFHIPQEAMDAASTGELLGILKRIWMTRADLYNNPSDYLGYLSASFNVTNECLRREDLAETTLASYKLDQFMPRMNTGGKKNADYNVACRRQESAIILEEIILATDLAFDQMDDAMRRETLEAVEEKRQLREKGTFECSASKGGFYTYIGEMLHFGHGSKWYDYICGQVPENEQMLAHIDNYLWDWIH